MKPTVYLAGPVSGLTYDSGNEWRLTAAKALAEHGIVTRSPLRGKEYLRDAGRIDARGDYTMALSTPKGIVTRDRMDCMTSDLVLMNLFGARRISIGSMIEVGWADSARRPLILVMEAKGNPHEHDMVCEVAGYRVEQLSEGLHIACAILAEQATA